MGPTGHVPGADHRRSDPGDRRADGPDHTRLRREFRLLVTGNAVSTLGNSVYLIAVTLLLKDLTGSPVVLGAFQFLALLPGFVLSPVTGAIVDRVSRRQVLIVSDLARGMLMLAAGAALTVPTLRTPWLVLPVAFLAGIGHAFFVPAVHAFVPVIVPSPRLHHANGIRAAITQGANLSGNAVGGALYALLGAPLLFVANGVTFLLSAWQETAIRRDHPRPDRIPDHPSSGLLSEARTGLRTVIRGRRLRRLVVSQAGLFVVSPVLLIALPFIVLDTLGLSEGVVGVLFAAALGGGILSFLASRALTTERLLQLPLPAIGYGLLGVSFASVVINISVSTLAIAAVATGAAAAMVYLYTVTWVQQTVEPSMHGRLFAAIEAASSLVAPLSYLGAGVVLEFLGPPRWWYAFAGVAVLAAVWALRLIVGFRRSSNLTVSSSPRAD